MQDKPTIAIIGGTGDLGSGLARLWARAGYPIVIGSRNKEKAEAMARDLCATGGCVRGDENPAAARAADIVVLSVPYTSHDAIVEEIKGAVEGKVVVDAAVPLVPPKVSMVQLPAAGSPAGLLLAVEATAPTAVWMNQADSDRAATTTKQDGLVSSRSWAND